MNEYILANEEYGNQGILRENDDDAVISGADIIIGGKGNVLIVKRIERNADTHLHDSQDDRGEYHCIDVARIEKAVGIIWLLD